jgi:hypothetical protein
MPETACTRSLRADLKELLRQRAELAGRGLSTRAHDQLVRELCAALKRARDGDVAVQTGVGVRSMA